MHDEELMECMLKEISSIIKKHTGDSVEASVMIVNNGTSDQNILTIRLHNITDLNISFNQQ